PAPPRQPARLSHRRPGPPPPRGHLTIRGADVAMPDRFRPRWVVGRLLVFALAGLPLACRSAEQHAEAEYARDLAQHKYRTGLARAELINGGIHDLWTDTVCTSTPAGSRHLHRSSHTSCQTTRLGFKDGAGIDFVFYVVSH